MEQIVITLKPIELISYRDRKPHTYWLNALVVDSFKQAIDDWLKAGHAFRVTETYRSIETQRKLKQRKPKLACKAGWSLHGHGRAVDFDVRSIGGAKELIKFYEHMAQYGWWTIFNAPNKPIKYQAREAWHLQRTQPVGIPSRDYLRKLAQEHGATTAQEIEQVLLNIKVIKTEV